MLHYLHGLYLLWLKMVFVVVLAILPNKLYNRWGTDKKRGISPINLLSAEIAFNFKKMNVDDFDIFK